MQPTRFRARDPGDIAPRCVMAAAAAEMFQSVACISTDAHDVSLLPSHVLKPFWKYPDMVAGLHGQGTTSPLVKLRHNKRKPVSIYATQMAIDMVRGECSHRYRVFKLRSPDHITITIWDTKMDTMEMFDPSGNVEFSMRQMIVRLFKQAGRQLPTLRFVNEKYLQQEDEYCQTYIYYYLHERLLAEEPSWRVVTALQSMTPMQRFELMNSFWHGLLRSGGGAERSCTSRAVPIRQIFSRRPSLRHHYATSLSTVGIGSQRLATSTRGKPRFTAANRAPIANNLLAKSVQLLDWPNYKPSWLSAAEH
jgi:hypothetical protein